MTSRIVLIVLLLLSFRAQAYDQIVEPSSTVSETNNDCTTTNAHTRCSDNSDSTFCDGGDQSTAHNYVIRFGLPTPSSNPSTSTNAQTWVCRFQKSSAAGSGSPDVTIDTYCGGTQIDAGSNTVVSSTTPVDVTETFTMNSGLCGSDGSGVELEIIANGYTSGGPTGRRGVDSIDCDWQVTYAPPGDQIMFIGMSDD